MCDFQVMTRSRTEFLTGNLHMTPFKEINSRGYQMYSAGMNNYLRFAEAHDFSGLSKRITAS